MGIGRVTHPHLPHPVRRHPGGARAVEALVWTLILELAGVFVLFLLMGAYALGEVLPLAAAFAAAAVLWLVRTWRLRRPRPDRRDHRYEHEIERRGF